MHQSSEAWARTSFTEWSELRGWSSTKAVAEIRCFKIWMHRGVKEKEERKTLTERRGNDTKTCRLGFFFFFFNSILFLAAMIIDNTNQFGVGSYVNHNVEGVTRINMI